MKETKWQLLLDVKRVQGTLNVVRGSVVDRKDSNDRLDQYAVDHGR